MRETLCPIAFLSLVVLLSGCAQTERIHETYPPDVASKAAIDVASLDPELLEKILAMDPDHVTGKDVEEVLSQAPAPRILNIRGGWSPICSIL